MRVPHCRLQLTVTQYSPLKFVAFHGSVHNHFNAERHLYSRSNFKLNRAVQVAENVNKGSDRSFAAPSMKVC